MKYILQVNTGSFTHTAADGAAITAKLEKCLNRIDASKVIYGWSANREVNETIVHYLDKKGIEKYLWLPVFGEIHTPETADAFVDVTGCGNHAIDDVCEGESFDFVCQSSAKNLAHAIQVYHDLTDGLPVDGVFLDRIRYASAANSVKDLYGCWCSRCKERYLAAGVSEEAIRPFSEHAGITPFIPSAMEGGVYRYADPNIDALMRVKRQTISEAVATLCTHFRQAGKKVGIDTFAGGVADFVGQDLATLGSMVDFIKPMVYLRTHAPAGVPYEVGAMGEAMAKQLSLLGGADACSMEAGLRQIKALMDTGAAVAPGIDTNAIDPICTSTTDYVCAWLDQLESIGCQSAVLSWDAMRMSDEVLEAIAHR